ncbi:hypothetical protein B0O99DRAFT_608847 [Bisporella sp. PMI_857]|nr:hypothetical protein B0O99DRAFT_608847 [Bisporella sp. PMI_857]
MIMPCPLTFGVELEFALATVPDRFEIHLELEGSKRHYRFQPTSEDIAQKNSSSSISPKTIHHHIAQTLKDNGFAANPEDPDPGKYNNFNMWSVKEDASIEPPEDNPFVYTWIPIEVTSPKFAYSKNAINEVMAICKLIAGTYIVDCNRTTGLHVHVGYGSGEDESSVRRLDMWRLMGRCRGSTQMELENMLTLQRGNRLLNSVSTKELWTRNVFNTG